MGEFCLLLLLDELDVAGGGDGDDEDADVREGDDEVAVVVDALDSAFDALEGTSSTLTWPHTFTASQGTYGVNSGAKGTNTNLYIPYK